MFKRLHDKSTANITKNQTMQQPTQPPKTKRTYTARTYSQRYKPQRDLNEQVAVPTVELIKNDEFIFQGQIKKGLKHGEGIMLMKNGTFIIGCWRDDLLDGRAFIISPLGSKLLTSFSHGKLSGWAMSIFQRRVVKCFFFYDNQMEGEKLTYDRHQELWVSSKNSQRGKLDVITHVEKGVITQPPSFLQSQQLRQIICRFILNRQAFLEIDLIKRIHINESTSYLGFTNQEGRPNGMGMIYNHNEVYMGNYYEGMLQHLGRISFENGDIYHGGMSAGAFWGQGVYYTPSKNTTKVLYADDSQSVVEREFNGYVMVDVQAEIPNCVNNNNSSTGIKGNTLKEILEDMEPYYLLTFVQNVAQKGIDKDKSLYSEYGHSENGQNMSDVRESPKNQQNTPSSKKSSQPPQKWIKLTEQPEMIPPLELERSRSVEKREVKKKNSTRNRIGVKIRGSQEEQFEKSRTYDNNQGPQLTGQGKMMPEIKFGRPSTPGKEPKSLQLDQIRLRNNTIGHRIETRKDKVEPSKIKESEELQDASVSSENTQTLKAVFSQIKQHRKKIFY